MKANDIRIVNACHSRHSLKEISVYPTLHCNINSDVKE